MDGGPDVPHEVRERALREGLAAWRAQGLLSPEQHDRLLATIGAPPPAPERAIAHERKLSRGVTILVNLGAIVLAAGLLVFFASNWIEFGRAAKIASLFALTLFFYVAGFELTQQGGLSFPKLGLALIFLGCVMFGADIVLLALIYDLTARHAWSFLIDWTAWLAVAYLVRSRLVLFLGLVGIVAWFGAEVGYCWGGYWLYLGRPFHFIGLGACMLAVAGIHGRRGQRGFAAAWALAGLLLIYLSTLVLSIFDVQKNVRLDTSTAPALVWLMLVAPYVVAVAALAIVHVRWRRAALTDPPVLLVLFLLVVMTVAAVIATTPDPRAPWFILLLTALTAAGVYLGIAWESPVFLNTSLVFTAINLYTRFYEYFWDAMPKSLFFIVGGATLILGGIWVERLRRRLVRRFAGATA
jgi:uncharacterized membrane protein